MLTIFSNLICKILENILVLNMLSSSDIQIIINKLDKFEERVNLRFEDIDRKFEEIDKKFEIIDKKFEMVFERFEIIQNILLDHNRRLDKLEKRMDSFEIWAKKSVRELSKRNKILEKRNNMLEKRINIGGKGLLNIQ